MPPRSRPSLRPQAKRRRWPRPLKPARSPVIANSKLEEKREALDRRLASLCPQAKATKGYGTAKSLLGNKYIHASLAARAALIQAADFLITVLEKLPLT